jgi:spore germination protein GerM
MPVSAAFWIFLLIVMVIAFFMLLPKIKNINLAQKTTETNERREKNEERKKEDEEKTQAEKTAMTEKPEKKPQAEKPVAPEQKEPEKKPQAEKPVASAQSSTTPAQPSTTPAQPSTPPAPVSIPPVKPVETNGSIYLIQKANDGASLALVKVNRNFNPNTPLTDSINTLLAGPAPDEIMREIESRVPDGSRLLSARVDDGTAFLNFNKEFTYSSWGREGCEVQIKQIVWTATEFPNVRNVQFLIEGKRVDFLSEGVVIRNPIGR